VTGILFLCTANACRSVMAQALLSARLAALGVELPVASAGLLGGGRPPPPEVVSVMAARCIDVTSHRSRVVTADDLAAADLILGLTREHVRHAAVLLPAIQETRLGGAEVLTVMAQVTFADIVTILAVPIVLQPGRVGHVALGGVLVAAAAALLFGLARLLAGRDWVQRVRDRSKQRRWALDLRLSLLVLFVLAWIAQKGGTSILIAGFAAGLVFVGVVRADNAASPAASELCALNAATGQPLWQIPVTGAAWSATPGAGNAIYTGNNAGVLDAWQVTTGNHLWSYRAAGALDGNIAVAGGIAYVGSSNHRVYAVTTGA